MSRADVEKIGGLKQSDMALLILVVALSLGISYFIGNMLINTPNRREIQVENVQPIGDVFTPPSQDVFVKDYINPTELIKIGNSKNDKPFANTQN